MKKHLSIPPIYSYRRVSHSIAACIVAFLCYTASLHAQDEKMWIGIAPGPVIASGSFGNAYKTGIGALLSFRYKIRNDVAVGFNTGFYTLGSKADNQGSVDALPFMLTGEYIYPVGQFRLFGGLEMGLHFANLNQGAFKGRSTSFAFSPFIGARYEVAQRLDVEASLRYTLVTNANTSTAALDPTTGSNVGWQLLPIFIGICYRFGE